MYYEESLDLIRENKIIENIFPVFVEVIGVCKERGDDKKAVEWCEQAIEFAGMIGNETACEKFQERRLALLNTEE